MPLKPCVAVATCAKWPSCHNGIVHAADAKCACRYVSYALPIFCHLTYGKGQHPKGPFNLGALSDVIGWIAVAWVVFITVRPLSARTLSHVAACGMPEPPCHRPRMHAAPLSRCLQLLHA